MTEQLRRGSVVLRGDSYSVVWDASSPRSVLVLPLRYRKSARRAGEVQLELNDLVAGGVPLPWAIITCRRPLQLERAALTHVGELTGPALCRVVQGVIRASMDAVIDKRWGADYRRHRRTIKEERPVNLVAA